MMMTNEQALRAWKSAVAAGRISSRQVKAIFGGRPGTLATVMADDLLGDPIEGRAANVIIDCWSAGKESPYADVDESSVRIRYAGVEIPVTP